MVLVRDVDPAILLKNSPIGGDLRPYLPRDADQDVRAALSAAPFTLIVYEHNSGVRRTAYEALLASYPDYELILKPLSTDLARQKGAATAVVWLDGELDENFIDLSRPLTAWLGRHTARRALGVIREDRYENPRLRGVLDPLRPTIVRLAADLSGGERLVADQMFPEAAPLRMAGQLAGLSAETQPPKPIEPSDPFAAHVADYRPDTEDGVDRLGIGADVRMLADLVVSRMITPPLSIGLFGSWGSGKSFFMRQMRLRVRALADSARAAETGAGAHGKSVSSYCSSVRQISFNAWHYSEANLLASLATHIFDNLAASGAENDLQRQADLLAERRKTEKTLLGRLSAVRLERRTLTARQKQANRRRKPREYVRAVFDSLTDADKAWIGSRIGVDRPTAEDLERLARETGGLRSDVAEFWRRLRQDPVPLLVLIGGLVTVLVVTLLVGRSQVSGLLGGLTVVSSALTVVLRMRASAGRIHQALGKLGGPSEEDEETERRLAELDAESDRLEKAVAELAPGLDLVSFAESRVSDYVEHLGVVSLLRKDLETFATMLAEVPHGSGKIERTVLYIDDLDRCPPKVVVQVLEAIHLLLALPVFVVVVGVDSRWLKKAVEQHYEEMLGDDPETFAENYLEKIFQVPFTLSPMDDPGFAGLVRGLAETEIQDSIPAPVPAGKDQATGGRAPVEAALPLPSEEPAPSSERSTIDVRPPRLVISPVELDFLPTLAPFIRSPRAAKRLLNLYRLLRARFSGEELAGFLADGDREAPFRAVLVLLAVHVGHPDAIRWFDDLEATGPEDTALEIVSSMNDHELRPKLERGLSGDSWPRLAASYQRWLPLVNRFSFARDRSISGPR